MGHGRQDVKRLVARRCYSCMYMHWRTLGWLPPLALLSVLGGACDAFDASVTEGPADAGQGRADDAAAQADAAVGDARGADDGAVVVDAGPDAAVPHVVFVTATEYAPDFGSAAAAATVCAGEAAARYPGATWTAWLGIAGALPVGARVGLGVGPWRLPSGAAVARTTQDLVNGELDGPIDEDASGAKVPPSDVWTGVKSDGTSAVDNRANTWPLLTRPVANTSAPPATMRSRTASQVASADGCGGAM